MAPWKKREAGAILKYRDTLPHPSMFLKRPPSFSLLKLFQDARIAIDRYNAASGEAVAEELKLFPPDPVEQTDQPEEGEAA